MLMKKNNDKIEMNKDNIMAIKQDNELLTEQEKQAIDLILTQDIVLAKGYTIPLIDLLPFEQIQDSKDDAIDCIRLFADYLGNYKNKEGN